MEQNKAQYISKENLLKVEEGKKVEGYYMVNIPGKKIQSKKDFLEFMAQKFKLPDSDGWDSFFDWMRDLSWIPNRKICIIINDYQEFLESDIRAKKYADDLLEWILLFWKGEVQTTVVGGKTRTFVVYMVV